MPSPRGVRDAVSQRPVRHDGRPGPRIPRLVSVVAAFAIVGVIGPASAAVARTPSIDDPGLVASTTPPVNVTRDLGELLSVVPSVGSLALAESVAPEPRPRPEPQPRPQPSVASSASRITPRRAPETRNTRNERERSRPAAERRPERRAERRPERRPERRAPRIVGASRWRVAPSASWYGPGLYGNRTACGQVFTRGIVGVAHRTLPCGTLVQLRWQGRSAIVPVIDRGPFGHARNVFDLSARLACVVLRPPGQKDGCFTRHNVRWRIVDRRR